MPARLLSATMIPLFLLGCAAQPKISEEEFWAETERCAGKELCIVASLLATLFEKQAGKKYGNSLVMRGAETDDRIVTISIDVPAAILDEPVRKGRTIKQQIDDALRTNICKQEQGKRFFSLGGELHLISYLPSGAEFSNNIIDSCESALQ